MQINVTPDMQHVFVFKPHLNKALMITVEGVLDGAGEQRGSDERRGSDQKQPCQSKLYGCFGFPWKPLVSLPVSRQSIQTSCIKIRLIHHGGLHYLSPEFPPCSWGKRCVVFKMCLIALTCLVLYKVVFTQRHAPVGHICQPRGAVCWNI